MSEDADFWGLIGGTERCLMTTNEGGGLRSRPVVAAIDRASHEFRLLSRLSDHRVDDLAANPDVNLAFIGAAGGCLSVVGQAYVTQDARLIEALWSDEAARRFNCSADDPDIAVIRIVPTRADAWDRLGRLRQSWSSIKPRRRDAA
jgi:general stress protein 26